MNVNCNKGFSLIELMVSTAIVAVSVLVLMSLSIFSANFTLGMKERIQAKDASLRAEYIMRVMFGSAILVDAADLNGLPQRYADAGAGGDPNPGTQDYDGHIIADQNFNQMFGLPAGGVSPIAMFLREFSTTSYSNIRRTGIWYKSPTPTTSGILFIDSDSNKLAVNPLNPFPAPPVGSGYQGQFIDRLTEFQISKNIQINGIGRPKVREVIFRFTFRYFGNPMTSQQSWCPAADISAGTAGCNATRFNDLTHTFRVALKNNDLSDDPRDFQGLGASIGTAIQRPLGPIHFFRLSTPRGL